MVDFNARVWDSESVYMVDFGRAPRTAHPHRSCPDIDRYGFSDDAFAAEHGPIVSARVGQPRVDVRFFRTEISTTARLYAVAADGRATIRILAPTGPLPGQRATTISFRPVAAGRTSIEIRYHWPDGPIIGRLYVAVRATRTIRCRVHLVALNGSGFGNSFLGEARPVGVTAAQHRTNRIAQILTDANHVLEPHGIQVANDGTVNTAWTNAILGGPALPTPGRRVMRAMAASPNRSSTRLNIFLVDWAAAMAMATPPPFAIGFVALGPPVVWAVALGMRWPNTAAGNVGSGIVIDTSAAPFTGPILAHEFGHVFHLSSLTPAGVVNQWHSIGDNNASRDDILTRRRMMYPFTSLTGSANAWRRDVGYGNNMGSLIMQRRLTQDSTLDESGRAYSNATAARVYAL